MGITLHRRHSADDSWLRFQLNVRASQTGLHASMHDRWWLAFCYGFRMKAEKRKEMAAV